MNELRRPLVDRDCMLDPIADPFIEEIWHTIAENNTKIYRAVFRCMPDNQVKDWPEYHQYIAYEQRFNQLQGVDVDSATSRPDTSGKDSAQRTGPPGAGASLPGAQIKAITKVPTDIAQGTNVIKQKMIGAMGGVQDNENLQKEKEHLKTWAEQANKDQAEKQGRPLHRQGTILDEKDALKGIPEDEAVGQRQKTPESQDTSNEGGSSPTTATSGTAVSGGAEPSEKVDFAPAAGATTSSTGRHRGASTSTTIGSAPGTAKRRRRGTTRSSRRDFSASDDILSVEEAEELLGMVQGQLVVWPYDW